jgi:Heterokaryon incompatibility protein (HET)
MPTRVIDLGAAKPRVLETQGQPDHYMALSYSWGAASSAMLKLNGENYKDLQNAIDWSKLALTHQEAIQVAKELNYRYIWIDALCIIQGDRQDWAQQSALVPEIYGNAELTLVAGRSNDARNGFLKSTYNLGLPHATIPFRLPDCRDLAECQVGPTRKHLNGPIDERGWCFQESLLSRRMIIYGKEQLSFCCRDYHNFEDGKRDSLESSDEWYNLSVLKLDPIITKWKTRDILATWYAMTNQYSTRGFFDPRDIHAALCGPVMRFQKALHKIHTSHRYMAGLWEADMIRGLLWRSDRIRYLRSPGLKDPEYEGKQVYRAPSWSWMALVGPILHQSALEGMEPEDGACKPANPDGRTWAVDQDGWGPKMIEYEKFPATFKLAVKGYIRPVQISRISQFPTLYDYDIETYWHYDYENERKHTFLLEAEEEKPLKKKNEKVQLDSESWPFIIGRGLFDRESQDSVSQLWAMAVGRFEGLLLKQVNDPKDNSIAYKRLGIFALSKRERFYKRTVQGKQTVEQLREETIMLV